MDFERVLVVEDEWLIADSLVGILADIGLEIVGPHAKLGLAVAAATSEQFDFALLDINLAKEAAYPVADVLMSRGIPFAFTTAHDAEALPAQYRGVIHLAKPYGAISVAEVVRALRSKAAIGLPGGPIK